MRTKAAWSGKSGNWIGSAMRGFPAFGHYYTGSVTFCGESSQDNRPIAGDSTSCGGSACYTIANSVTGADRRKQPVTKTSQLMTSHFRLLVFASMASSIGLNRSMMSLLLSRVTSIGFCAKSRHPGSNRSNRRLVRKFPLRGG
jgi:hypothetical protein